MAGVKKEAAKLILQAIESGLADSDAGDVKTVDEVREEFGLTRDESITARPLTRERSAVCSNDRGSGPSASKQ